MTEVIRIATEINTPVALAALVVLCFLFVVLRIIGGLNLKLTRRQNFILLRQVVMVFSVLALAAMELVAYRPLVDRVAEIQKAQPNQTVTRPAVTMPQQSPISLRPSPPQNLRIVTVRDTSR